jgi:hypothetical protein
MAGRRFMDPIPAHAVISMRIIPYSDIQERIIYGLPAIKSEGLFYDNE